MSEVTTDTPAETTPDTAAAPAAGAVSAVAATPAPAPAPKPKAAPTVDKPEPATDRPDPVALALKSLQADNASLAADLKTERAARAKAERERDTHAAQVDVLTKRTAEAANVARLRDLLPSGVPDLDIRAALGVLHESNKVDRYGADSEAVARSAFDALKAANSSLLRVAPPPGGPGGAPTQTPPRPQHKSPFG